MPHRQKGRARPRKKPGREADEQGPQRTSGCGTAARVLAKCTAATGGRRSNASKGAPEEGTWRKWQQLAKKYGPLVYADRGANDLERQGRAARRHRSAPAPSVAVQVGHREADKIGRQSFWQATPIALQVCRGGKKIVTETANEKEGSGGHAPGTDRPATWRRRRRCRRSSENRNQSGPAACKNRAEDARVGRSRKSLAKRMSEEGGIGGGWCTEAKRKSKEGRQSKEAT